MEGIHTLKDLLNHRDWLAKVDLKDAYFAIPIHQSHHQYLRFTFQGKRYQFRCLPFGLSSAPWVFTKTLKPALALLREMDSIHRRHSSPGGVQGTSNESRGGCSVPPTMPWFPDKPKDISAGANSGHCGHGIPLGKMKKIRAESRAMARADQVSARALARLVGTMNATVQVIPPAPLFYHHLQMALSDTLNRSSQSYEVQVPLSQNCREELMWWDNHMIEWNGKSFLSKEIDLTIDSDASLTGWGAVCQNQRTGGPWSQTECRMHINCLELLAATLAVHIFLKNKSRISVLLRLDNTTAVAYINNLGGTVSKELVDLANNLWMWCLKGTFTSQPDTYQVYKIR